MNFFKKSLLMHSMKTLIFGIFNPPKIGQHVFHAEQIRLFGINKIVYRYWHLYFDTVKFEQEENFEQFKNIKSLGEYPYFKSFMYFF